MQKYGTSEEKQFVELFARRLEGIEIKFKDIYLVRNEREIKIFNDFGMLLNQIFCYFVSNAIRKI